jgi:hypothetical protein
MNSPFDLFLSRAEAHGKVRYLGPDQIRMSCPVCGGTNDGTLSARRGDTGAVLLKCFKSDCHIAFIAQALGLDLSDLFPPKPEHGHGRPQARRRSLITANEALDLARDEIGFAAIVAANIGHGVALTVADRERCLVAAARLNYLHDEVRA